ncbi:MAG TPA: hypothetical protein VFW11_04585 [Cyclobacteriaceae bacterium]|nr:hypothetical protein [Cyclobacteriaceae bacterium]
MITFRNILFSVLVIAGMQTVQAQENNIETIFKSPGRSGGYGAISNKFTTINGEFANIVELYGGWYINQRFLIGGGFAGSTNYISVPQEFSTMPGLRMSYQYGQVGLVTDYIIASNKAVHVGFHVMTGAGFTLQYYRPSSWSDLGQYDYYDYDHDENWFFMIEPGIQVELNVLRWMRFSPGISYRFIDGSNAKGLTDNDLRGASVNLTFKFGRF